MAWNGLQYVDVAVVGGGLAGLTAAAHAARSGGSTALFERSAEPGGRAQTRDEHGFQLNLGPHALYNGGVGVPVLRELGVGWEGGSPDAGEAAAYVGERLHTMPIGGRSLLTTDLFGVRDRLEYGRVMAGLSRTAADDLAATSLRDWLSTRVRRPRVRAVIDALFRVVTYSNVPARLSAGAALEQWATGAKGVTYIDGGWRQLVSGLRAAAEAAGATVHASAPVRSVHRRPGGFELSFDGGHTLSAGSVVVALPVEAAAAVVAGEGSDTLRARARAAIPSFVSTYDVCLSALPAGARMFALGLDQPFYLSVHSAAARLAPAGAAIVSLARYNDVEEKLDPGKVQADLERLLDVAQPGWRRNKIFERFLPAVQVQSDIPRADGGGIAGRPGAAVPGAAGLFVAGDWVGPAGMLADVSLASGREAGRLAAAAAGATAGRQPATIAG